MVHKRKMEEFLQVRRTRMNLTHKAVAKASNLTVEEVLAVELGNHKKLSDTALKRFALTLKMHPDQLLAGLNRLPEDLIAIFKQRPILIADIIRNLEHCTDHEVKHVSAILAKKKIAQPRVNKEEFDQYWKMMERITKVEE